MKIHIRINVDKENKEDIKGILKLLFDENNLDSKIKVYFAQLKGYEKKVNTCMSAKEFEIVRKEMVDYLIENNWDNSFRISVPSKIATACGAMRNFTCVIGPKGELYRCEHCLGIKEWVIGNVDTGFWHNSVDMKFLKHETQKKCLECKLWPVCAGGCLGDKILNGFMFDCEAYEQRIRTNIIWAINKKIEKDDLVHEFC